METLYGLHIDGDGSEAVVHVWGDHITDRDTVLEGQELQTLLPKIMALQNALSVVMQTKAQKA